MRALEAAFAIERTDGPQVPAVVADAKLQAEDEAAHECGAGSPTCTSTPGSGALSGSIITPEKCSRGAATPALLELPPLSPLQALSVRSALEGALREAIPAWDMSKRGPPPRAGAPVADVDGAAVATAELRQSGVLHARMTPAAFYHLFGRAAELSGAGSAHAASRELASRLKLSSVARSGTCAAIADSGTDPAASACDYVFLPTRLTLSACCVAFVLVPHEFLPPGFAQWLRVVQLVSNASWASMSEASRAGIEAAWDETEDAVKAVCGAVLAALFHFSWRRVDGSCFVAFLRGYSAIGYGRCGLLSRHLHKLLALALAPLRTCR